SRRLRLVENEVRLRIPVDVVAPVREKRVAQPRLVRDLQKAGGDDLIRIDVLDREKHDTGGDALEWVHDLVVRYPLSVIRNPLSDIDCWLPTRWARNGEATLETGPQSRPITANR